MTSSMEEGSRQWYAPPEHFGSGLVYHADMSDAKNSEGGDYSEWCTTTTDLADAELAALVRDDPTLGRGHRLRYSGACTLVLPDE